MNDGLRYLRFVFVFILIPIVDLVGDSNCSEFYLYIASDSDFNLQRSIIISIDYAICKAVIIFVC